MKKKSLFYLILGIFILSLFVIIPFSKSDIENSDKFTFKENELYNEVNKDGIIPDYSYNLREKDYYTQNYEADYSFDNDIGKYNESISLIKYVDNDCFIYGIDNYDNHYSVLNGTVDDTKYVRCELGYQFYEGIVQYWIMKTTDVDTLVMTLTESSSQIVIIYFYNDGSIRYKNNLGNIIDTTYNYYINNWTNIRIDIIGVWFDLYINGLKIVDSALYYGGIIGNIDGLTFTSTSTSEFLLDAVGIVDTLTDTTTYIVDDNLIPEKIEINDLEIDKFEFDYNNDDFRNKITPFEYSENVYNNFYINRISDIDNRLIWSTYQSAVSYYDYLYLDDINRTDYQFNITTTVLLDLWKDSEQILFIDIYCYDYYMTSTLVYTMYIQTSGGIRLYDYCNNIADSVATGISYSEGEIADFNMYFNTDDNLGVLNCNGTNISFNLPKGYFGLQKVAFRIQKRDNNVHSSRLEIYNIGVYFNGTSIVSDFNNIFDDYQQSAYSLYQLHEFGYYDIKKYHLLDYELLENETIVYNYNSYQNYKDTDNIFERQNYTVEMNYNLMNNWSYLYSNLIFEYFFNISYPTYINSEGIVLESNIYDNNELFIDYYYISDNYYINTDTENNYFYATDNKLYWNFNKTEVGKNYMSITFEIDSYLIDDNYGVYFNSYITDNYTGNLILDYDIGSNSYFTLNKSNSVKYSEYNLSIKENYFLEKIVVVISNDDIENVEGFTDGYIDSINLGYQYNFIDVLDDLDDSIIDLEFTEGIIYVVIILILFIIPCYLVYERLGKKVVIPMFLLIVLVLMISTFLPIWLGIIMLFSGIFFIYYQSQKEGLE